jgi:hypothetical protein
MVHKFQNLREATTGRNMVKSSSLKAPSTLLIFPCPHAHAKTSESLTFICMREREKVHCKCAMYCTGHFSITLFNVGNALLCVIYK